MTRTGEALADLGALRVGYLAPGLSTWTAWVLDCWLLLESGGALQVWDGKGDRAVCLGTTGRKSLATVRSLTPERLNRIRAGDPMEWGGRILIDERETLLAWMASPQETTADPPPVSPMPRHVGPRPREPLERVLTPERRWALDLMDDLRRPDPPAVEVTEWVDKDGAVLDQVPIRYRVRDPHHDRMDAWSDRGRWAAKTPEELLALGTTTGWMLERGIAEEVQEQRSEAANESLPYRARVTAHRRAEYAQGLLDERRARLDRATTTRRSYRTRQQEPAGPLPRDWTEQAKALPLEAVVQATGATVTGRHATPCPVCGYDQRGTGDRRPPVRLKGQRWSCLRKACDGHGDALDFVGAVLGMGTNPTGEDFRRVGEWFAQHWRLS